MTLPRMNTLVRVALLAPVALLALAACGDDGTDGGSADPGTTSTPTDTASTTQPSTEPSTPATTSTAPSTDGPKNTPTGPPTSPTEPSESSDPDVPPVDLTRPPATYDAALYHFQQAGGQRLELTRFETPSGNLYCVVKSKYIPTACELGAGGIEDADYCGSDGPTQFIGRIELDDGQPTPVCNSDTIRQAGAETLAYGDVATVSGSGIECLAEQIGVTCLDTSSTQGFFLAKGNYVLLTAG